MAAIDAERLVFVDETGTHTRMTPTYAVSPRGERASGTVPLFWAIAFDATTRATPR